VIVAVKVYVPAAENVAVLVFEGLGLNVTPGEDQV
jgi:hypothetical protein